MTYLLDTSALLAFYFGEPGAERVRELLSDQHTAVRLSVLTVAEFWSRLRAEGAEDVFEQDWRRLSELIHEVVPVSLAVVLGSVDLRRAAVVRLPLTDAIIAAAAAHHGSVLIHRDPHFASIPSRLLQQEALPLK